MSPPLRLTLVAALVAAGGSPTTSADEPEVRSQVAADFAESMQNVRLRGRFTTRLPDGTERASRPDEYAIASIEPFGRTGNRYTVNAAIIYRRADDEAINLTVPVVVEIDAAGPTPVLSVRDLSIPLLGSDFGACLLFDGDQYAGTWSHGDVGGAMYGRVLRGNAAAVDRDGVASPAADEAEDDEIRPTKESQP